MIVVSLCAAISAACTSHSRPSALKSVSFRGESISVPAKWKVEAREGIGAVCMTQAVAAQSVVVEVDQLALPSLNQACYDDQPPTASDQGTVVLLAQVAEPPRAAPSNCEATTIHEIRGFLCNIPQTTQTFHGSFLNSKSGVVVAVAAPSAQAVQQVLGSITGP